MAWCSIYKITFLQMCVISVQNQKGGVGKTTLAIHVAHELVRRGDRVLLIDADPQGSARDWAAARADKPPFPVTGLDRPTIHRDLPEMAKDYTHVLIDGPPRVTELARSAILASDLVLVPVQPSPYDVWASQEVVGLIKEATIFKADLKASFVINRRIPNTLLGRDVVAALGDVQMRASHQMPTMKTMLTQRIIFAESAIAGLTVMEDGRDFKATSEIAQLVEELMGVLNG